MTKRLSDFLDQVEDMDGTTIVDGAVLIYSVGDMFVARGFGLSPEYLDKVLKSVRASIER